MKHKYVVQVGASRVQQAAIRAAQYIRDNVEQVKPSIQVEDGEYVVRMHSKLRITRSLAVHVSGVAEGIMWQRAHDLDLVSPLNDFYMGNIE